MTTATSFGDLNSGLQAGIINGNVTAQFRDMGSHNVIAGNDININYLTEIRPLAESLYRSLFSPSELFGRVQNELGLLISVLNATEHHASCYAKDIHRREVNAALEECHDLLLGLSKMKTHFDSMDHQTRVTWERLKWGVGDLEDMRTRLSTHVQNLTMLNTNMIMSSQANVESMLKKFIYEIRTGIRDRSSVSSISNGSPAPSDEELEAWREVRKELQGVGITPELFLQHREFITTTLRSSLDQGDLGGFYFEQYGHHEIQPVSQRQEVSSRSMAFSTSSEIIPTDQQSAQVQTAGPKCKMSMDHHAPTSYYGSHGNPVYHDSIRPAQPHRGAHLAPLHYFRGSVMQEANTKNVHSFRFNMWASAPQRANRIDKALHAYTRLQGDIHHPNAPPMPLEDVCGWRTSFPYLVSSLDEMNSPLNCDIILLEVNLELMTNFPPSGSRLSIQLDLEFGHPATSNVLMVNQMNNWTCSTRLYKEGREHWETYHDLPKPQSTKVKPLFESSWWARLFIELTKDKRIAEDSGQPESIYTTEEYTYQLFSSLSMVQEIRAIPSPPGWRRLSDEFQGHQGEESERMAILLWKFRRTRPGEVGTTTWRRLIPS